jgi:hypothetical protein
MSGEVGLVASPHGTIRKGRCAICRRPYESVGRGHLLLDGGVARGQVCLWCLEDGRSRAAELLRRRAARVRLLLDRFHHGLRAWGWAGLHRLLAEYAANLDRLAARAEKSGAWTAIL